MRAPTFSPWAHTSDDSYIYQLSLVLATVTVSLSSPFIFSLPPINSRNSDLGSHSRLFFPPLPTRTVRALHFYRGNILALSSLVGSRRIVLTHAINRRSQQLILFRFGKENPNLPRAGFELTDQHY